MNKKVILKSVIIFLTTLFVGFGITAFSFNLFHDLTQNQMRLLFALDVISLIAIGGGVMYFFESKKAKKRREQELQERHNKRVELRKAQYKDIDVIIAKNKFAA